MGDPAATLVSGAPGLKHVFRNGYGNDLKQPVTGASGLQVLRYDRTEKERAKHERTTPEGIFNACIVQRAHQVVCHHDGKLALKGHMPAGGVIFSEPALRAAAETEGAPAIVFVMTPVSLIGSVCESAGLTLNGDAQLGFITRHGHVDRRLLELALSANAQATDPSPFARLRADIIGQQLVIQLLQFHSTLAEALTGEIERVRGGLAPRQLRTACDLMDQGLEEALTLSSIASAAGCSPTHFSRAFKQSTGMAPFAWLLHRRVERAKEMLGTGRLPIAEVALAVGFAGQSQFTTAFRRVTGTTPAAWRRSVH